MEVIVIKCMYVCGISYETIIHFSPNLSESLIKGEGYEEVVEEFMEAMHICITSTTEVRIIMCFYRLENRITC